MKKLIYAFASLSLIALVGLASCKKGSEPSTEFKLNSSNISLSVGEEFILKAQNASGNVEWSVSDATIAKITPSNDGAECKVEGVKEGSATVTAKNGDKTATCAVTVEGAEKEDAPEIAAPGEGLTTIAIRVPNNAEMNPCKGIYAVGAFENTADVANGWDEKHTKEGFDFEKVEGTETWYKFTFKNDATFSALKVIAMPQTAPKDYWVFQWGKNTEKKENVTLVKEDEDVEFDTSENAGEVKLVAAPANKVIYVDVDAWQTAPCKPLNPAGTGTFDITLDLDGLVPFGVKVVGNWDAESEYGKWDVNNGLALTLANGKWSGTAEVPEGFQFKLLLAFSESDTYSWDSPRLVDNQAMSSDNKQVKTYTTEDFVDLPEPNDGEE